MNNIRIYIVSHGNISKELYAFLQYIAGNQLNKLIIPIVLKKDMSRENFLKFIYEKFDDSAFPIFLTDIPGGTPDIVAKIIVKNKKKGAVISGINIPMLTYLIKYNEYDNVEEFIDKLMEAGKNGIKKFYIPN